MKRIAGFKVAVPYILDYFSEYGIPIYICLDTNYIEISFKGKSSNDNKPFSEEILAALNHIYSVYPETKNFIDSTYIHFKIKASYWKVDIVPYIIGGILLGLFDEGQIDEFIGDTVVRCADLNLTSHQKSILKTVLSGGIMYSHNTVHERIYSSKGLYFKLVDSSSLKSPLLPTDIGIIILSLMKDKINYLRDKLDHPIDTDNGEVGYICSKNGNPSLLIIEHNDGNENEKIFTINHNGGFVI
jgi:hypothetical protein